MPLFSNLTSLGTGGNQEAQLLLQQPLLFHTSQLCQFCPTLFLLPFTLSSTNIIAGKQPNKELLEGEITRKLAIGSKAARPGGHTQTRDDSSGVRVWLAMALWIQPS